MKKKIEIVVFGRNKSKVENKTWKIGCTPCTSNNNLDASVATIPNHKFWKKMKNKKNEIVVFGRNKSKVENKT